MAVVLKRRLWLSALLASGVAASACVSTTGVLRPAPFPSAPTTIRASIPRPTRPPSLPDVIRTALDLRGVRYQLGGDSPSTGFDCSGFVRYVYALNHLELPRTVNEQFGLSAKIRAANVRAGDLIFFTTTGPGATHVGVVVSPTEFVHAPGSNGVVRLEHFDTPYWRSRFVGAERLF